MRQIETSPEPVAPAVEKVPIRKHRTELRHTRSPRPRFESDAGFVVEWQLLPIHVEPESNPAPEDSAPLRLSDLGA